MYWGHLVLIRSSFESLPLAEIIVMATRVCQSTMSLECASGHKTNAGIRTRTCPRRSGISPHEEKNS